METLLWAPVLLVRPRALGLLPYVRFIWPSSSVHGPRISSRHSILCRHQAVAGLTPVGRRFAFGLQRCRSNVFWSTRLIVYGTRKTPPAGE